MITQEQASQILYGILDGKHCAPYTVWTERRTCIASSLKNGVKNFLSYIPARATGVLHGWIDQAVLEIVRIAPVCELTGDFLSYRADQAGDTGILVNDSDAFLILEASIDDNLVRIVRHNIHD